MDVVGGFLLADGTRAKALTGVDDHSRFCVSAHLMIRETSQRVCEGLALALRTYGVPEQILTDNGKVFTGRFNRPPAEVLFDRVCRENGIGTPADPAAVTDDHGQGGAVPSGFYAPSSAPTGSSLSLAAAQAELDEWVVEYNTRRPHQALGMATPEERFHPREFSPGNQDQEYPCPTPTGPRSW